MPSLKTQIGTAVRQKIGILPYSVGRNLTVFPEDVFLVSYPKSGNTWTRFLISNLLYPELEITFANIQKIIPDIYLTSERQLLKIKRPRIIKSHEYFDPRYKKVIFIVRDPRDVTLSTYFHCLKYGVITDEISLEEFSEKFIFGKYHLIGESNPLGSWAENTGSWLGAKQENDNFLLLRYEDFKIDTAAQLHKISNFLSLSSSQSHIKNAIKNSSIERMRELELKHKNVWPARFTKREDIAFVRTAYSGEGKKKLPKHIVEKINFSWQETMKNLDYL